MGLCQLWSQLHCKLPMQVVIPKRDKHQFNGTCPFSAFYSNIYVLLFNFLTFFFIFWLQTEHDC